MKNDQISSDIPQDDDQFPGYPPSNPREDIYNREQAVHLPDEREKAADNDLDVPGSELDNDNEDIGEEDEENNYYSLGGENHHDLEDPS